MEDAVSTAADRARELEDEDEEEIALPEPNFGDWMPTADELVALIRILIVLAAFVPFLFACAGQSPPPLVQEGTIALIAIAAYMKDDLRK